MNILREIRKISKKSKKKKIMLIMLLSIVLTVNTYAWFFSEKETNLKSIEGKVNSWDISYVISEKEILDEEISLEMGAISEKNYNIRSFLDYFKNKNVYELETALAIHEYLDKNGKETSDDNIDKIYDIIRSEDDVFNEYLKEMVCNLNENLEQDMTESEEEMEM